MLSTWHGQIYEGPNPIYSPLMTSDLVNSIHSPCLVVTTECRGQKKETSIAAVVKQQPFLVKYWPPKQRFCLGYLSRYNRGGRSPSSNSLQKGAGSGGPWDPLHGKPSLSPLGGLIFKGNLIHRSGSARQCPLYKV